MRIIIGIGGGVAAYKATGLIRLFAKAGHETVAIPTASALEFVGAPTLEALSGNPVTADVFDRVPEVNHVRQAELADGVVIAPATADLLARLAAGRCDDLLTTTVLTTHAPVVLAPAMHTQMWEHPATQANVATLRARGVHVIEPAIGRLTGKDSGAGRMPEPEQIFAAASAIFNALPKGDTHPVYDERYSLPTEPVYAVSEDERAAQAASATIGTAGVSLGGTSAGASSAGESVAHAPENAIGESLPLAGRRVVITAGGTREMLDPVRFLGNRSTGKQGVALAAAARELGAQVHLIGANLEVPAPEGVQLTRVVSARELRDTVLCSAMDADVLIMSAAVADFRPAEYTDFKIKKTDNPDEDPVIHLVRNPDILREVVQRREDGEQAPGVIVGFAAETGSEDTSPLEFGRAKLARKGCDFLAVNTVGVSQGFGTDENTITLLSLASDKAPVFTGSKREVSEEMLRAIAPTLAPLS
ncbi:MAG: bifunctional phosphopantothenoylcysteine decarboxylase/phosphopantothenate synthase [Rothia sp. (in: high G+C Gram-positive bacteria)]|uniref:bifunctional phosphopantothenoylcysteine decarboxylase/phosphopantothenate synthase n=1 Tax=Rothia sp. (in: high G+C Gram-positive bacteria) TaxID=1885016 RepID=UPI0026E04889|nr:bifunctional phosphopantothenoylcysteine decarboxylase/phosphopantothenate synthase [Rothia sp. (in: high G+C Gram-positive bacteria)]MDO5750677.1 bifunctional phosphopantothenoylcysteine decarboxylase/phosphopantothenate synthase [Rothia sp. (in: high G+C Gram-positive bacteria)]